MEGEASERNRNPFIATILPVVGFWTSDFPSFFYWFLLLLFVKSRHHHYHHRNFGFFSFFLLLIVWIDRNADTNCCRYSTQRCHISSIAQQWKSPTEKKNNKKTSLCVLLVGRWCCQDFLGLPGHRRIKINLKKITTKYQSKGLIDWLIDWLPVLIMEAMRQEAMARALGLDLLAVGFFRRRKKSGW